MPARCIQWRARMGSYLGFLAVEGLRSPKMRIVHFLYKEWAGRLGGRDLA